MRRGLLAIIAFAAAFALLPATAAVASDERGFGVLPPHSGVRGPSGGSSSGSSGGSVQTTVKTCHLFANPSGYGESCVTPGSGGDSKTIREILGPKESLPSCFDTPISPEELAAEYPGQTPVDGSTFYVQTCITGLDENRSPANQPGEQVNNVVITIINGSRACYNYDEAHNKATPFVTDQVGHCVMTLTTKQNQVVQGVEGKNGQIPDIIIASEPSTRVRTREDVAFVDTATPTGGNPTRTPDLTVDGVTLWATMGAFKIYPLGPDGGVSKTCNGTEQVSPDDTPQTKPDACWYQYKRSSADQPGMTYPFRAEADWTVHYSADGVDHVLASFQKYDDLKLPVYDIQTLVIR